MATTRNQGATDQSQDANSTQALNHAQTPDQAAANRGAFAQSSYQNNQKQPTAGHNEGQDAEAAGGDDSNILSTAVQAGKKWLDESGVLSSATQVPQVVKGWSNKAVTSVGGLSTTQKVVGGALLLAGVAYLASRGRDKSSSSSSEEDDTDHRSGSKSSGYRQGSWAGYAGGKSASNRNSQISDRSEISSYGTERRASSGSGYGRSAASTGSTDTEFGSGSNARRGADSSRNYSADADGNRDGGYKSGSAYGSSATGSSPNSSRSFGEAANSNEEDYDTAL